MARRSVGIPLTVGIVMLLLLLALAAGWQVLVWSEPSPLSGEVSTLDWVLLILGSVFFVLVIIGLVWLCSWLVAEVRLNQRQRAFLDAVTHEMKTPLASFRLGLDTLGRHELGAERRREFITRMQEDLDRLDHTVHQVLSAARAEERGRIPRRKQDGVFLGEVLEGSVETIRERHALSEDAIRVRSRSGIRVRGDAAELGLIFGNLLENAVKYSDDPVIVRVSVEVSGDGRVRIDIADSGIGIPPGELRKIFRRFYRVGREVQRQVAGLGLGLFVVRNMVRRQGGRIRAKSEGAGRGSRFVVTLREDTRRMRGGAPRPYPGAPSLPRPVSTQRPAAHSRQVH
jgi:signal transduction histidine kinase